MALTKQPVSINFAQGLDQKTDPKQVQAGKFLSLQNTIFDKGGLLQKRNGFGPLSVLPDKSNTVLTTFNSGLTAVGSNIYAYSASSMTWTNRGALKPLQLRVKPLIRSNTNQIQADAAVASNGLVCTVFSDSTGSSVTYKYAIADQATGQNIVSPTLIPVSSGVVTGSPRVFVLGSYFIVAFTNVIGGTTSHLQYIAISSANPSVVTVNADIASAYISSPSLSWDAVATSAGLYFAYNTTTGGQSVRLTYLSPTLAVAAPKTFVGEVATHMSLCADLSTPQNPVIWAAYYDSASNVAKVLALDKSNNTILAPTSVGSGTALKNIASCAMSGVASVYFEVTNAYGYDASVPSNYISRKTVTQAGVVSGATLIARSVGLASKAFYASGMPCVLAAHSSSNQPTYFLIQDNGSATPGANIISKLAYQNGGGYCTLGLPSVSVSGTTYRIAYLYKDLIASVNKTQGLANANGIYSQTGVNLASFNFSPPSTSTSEIGSNLHVSGGMLWAFDGYSPVEQGFHLYPEYVEATTAAGSGGLTAQLYYYVALYEWSDNQGNIHRSAPSIPISITTTTSNSTNTINVPTLRLTYKTQNPVKVVLYRWSNAQQSFYQVTSITSPALSNPSSDYVTITDTLADSAILGNSLLYTTGGVVENIGPPATDNTTLFKSRLFLVDAEDRNLLWYSKQVIEGAPVELSDLLTQYIAPTSGAQGSTGEMTAIAPLDDKLIVFKNGAIYYIAGTGPDNTGANDDFSDPVFITATVGCTNQASIVQQPNGLMFQSDKGIWLLNRNLSTTYIGDAVEDLTRGATVLSAINVSGTNQIRFTLSTGVTLVYDYFFGQWGSFVNVPALSSVLYQGLHTYLNLSGQVFQETPGVYLDGSSPVLISFKTSWFNLAGLQGFERAYYFYLLGTYLSPHRLQMSIAYDYSLTPSQVSMVYPTNFSPTYGNDAGPYGSGSPYGGQGTLEQCRIFLQRQKCQSFQIQLSEIFDATLGAAAGAGLTLSGLSVAVGLKRGFKPLRAGESVG